MWQITLYELDKDKVKPKRGYNSPSGTFHFVCGICGEVVGIHADKCPHLEGRILRRDCCKNGHAVDWEDIK